MRRFHVQRGFTLLELLISISIGIFLTGALLTIVQMNRTVFGNQNLLSQLQDGERLAMAMTSDVIQTAGYFPSPHTNTAGGVFPASAPFGALQTVWGSTPGAQGDWVYVRYMTASGDGILNCSGQSNATGANKMYISKFWVSPPGATGNQLMCTMNGVDYALVSGVTSMTVLYGIQTNLAVVGRQVDTYMTAAQVTAQTAWSNVVTIQMNLTFTNPLYPGAGLPTIQIQRTIDVMGQGGPSI